MNITRFENHCCGCGECAAVCPVGAITMLKNKQGFYYPKVDGRKCVDCSQCVNRCSFNVELIAEKQNSVLDAYALKHSDPEVRADSRSGGVFSALSDIILDTGGVVYGCALVNCREAVHIRATTKEERNACRGSKYIQSKTHDAFVSVREDLINGLWVLFTGTACQVNAIADYCKDLDCSKLLLVDIVCYGIPSQKVWSDYLDFRSKQKKDTIVTVNFRDKKQFGWAAHKDTVFFSDGSSVSDDKFTKLFADQYILRKDCFACPYKNLHRVGDITIADCWGIAQHYPDFDDNQGVSLVLINTGKGIEFFGKLQTVHSIRVDIEKLMQPALKENWLIPEDYDAFWAYYHTHTFSKVIDKYVLHKEDFIVKVKRKIKAVLRRIYRLIFTT